MPTGLYRQTRRVKTGQSHIHCKRIDSAGKPDFSVVYITRIEFLRTTRAGALQVIHSASARGFDEGQVRDRSRALMNCTTSETREKTITEVRGLDHCIAAASYSMDQKVRT
jgi:hypothetical protein